MPTYIHRLTGFDGSARRTGFYLLRSEVPMEKKASPRPSQDSTCHYPRSCACHPDHLPPAPKKNSVTTFVCATSHFVLDGASHTTSLRRPHHLVMDKTKTINQRKDVKKKVQHHHHLCWTTFWFHVCCQSHKIWRCVKMTKDRPTNPPPRPCLCTINAGKYQQVRSITKKITSYSDDYMCSFAHD